ncbi:MAG: sn-glycerol-1-phosphate dehydrogenase [Treponema sp.]|nr:sn-glycerol-1-phosphate dehydrogenase [Treponema sp.]
MKRKQLPAIPLDECLASAGSTRALVTGKDVYRHIPELLNLHYNSQRVFIIADENTMQAAGTEIEQILLAHDIEITGKCIFPAEPRLHADYCHIETLVKKMSALGGYQPFTPVAIGAGTINDLVKQASADVSLPYLCIPTAASVDGYTSFGSAILKDGFKQTLSCEAPRCIVADTGVLSRAPSWLSSSGFGDLAGKIIAGSGWIIGDAAAEFGAKGSGRIEPRAWAMVQNGLYDYLDRSISAVHGDQDALQALFEALSITGFAMQYARDSRPVSGAEHLIAHIWEMDDLSINDVPVSHGHKVAMGTLAGTAFLEVLFADPNEPPPRSVSFRHPGLDERVSEIKTAFSGSPALESVLITGIEKFHDEENAAHIRDGFYDTWKPLREKVLEQIMPYSELKKMLEKAQCPVRPQEINLTRNAVIACFRRAQMIRNRYTELDLAWDLGCLETVLAGMEASEKYLY